MVSDEGRNTAPESELWLRTKARSTAVWADHSSFWSAPTGLSFRVRQVQLYELIYHPEGCESTENLSGTVLN